MVDVLYYTGAVKRPFPADLSVTAGQISTAGFTSDGIDAINFTSGNTSVTADTLRTSGANSWGAYVLGYGNVSLNTGTVETTGLASVGLGLFAVGGRDNSLTAHSVTTSGDHAIGIYNVDIGRGVNTSIAIDTLTTHGDYASGIRVVAEGQGGSVNVTAGSIKTDGKVGNGIEIYSQSVGGKINVDVRDINVSGYLADGMFVYGLDSDITVKAGHVATTGNYSFGVVVTGTYGDVVANIDSVETQGDSSFGALIGGENATINIGSVSTQGFNASGITAGADDTLYLKADSVSTSGYAARAVSANARHATAVLGDVTTTGDYSVGVSIAANQAAEPSSNTADLTINGAITVSGQGAMGLLGLSYGSLAIHNNGSIVSAGTAMNLLTEGTMLVDGTGTIETSGRGARGIYAFGYGQKMELKPVSIKTTGNTGLGIEAIAFSGDIIVDAGTIDTSGERAAGAFLLAYDGSVDVTAQQIVTRGNHATGLDIVAFGNDETPAVHVDVNSIVTTGGDAVGLNLVSYAGDSTASVKSVTTSGDFASAINAVAIGGALTLDAATVSTRGQRSYGVYGFGEKGATVTVGDVTTVGDYAPAVRVHGNGDVSIAATGTVTTSGAESAGLFAFAGLPVFQDDGTFADPVAGSTASVKANAVTAGGNGSIGIFAIDNYGSAAVEAATVSALGTGSTGIRAEARDGIAVKAGAVKANGNAILAVGLGSGATSIQTTGTITSTGGNAIAVFNAGGATSVNIAAGSVVTGAANGVLVQGGSGTITIGNAGTLAGGAGYAINLLPPQQAKSAQQSLAAAVTPGASITNTGTIMGAVSLGAGNDTLTNSGTFIATKDSVFGGGTDMFVNTGTLKIGSTAGTTVTFQGLDVFQNSGTIDLRNGSGTNTLVLPGTFVGSGNSTLMVDLGAGGSDKLVVQGAATGSTKVLIATTPNAATLLSQPLEIVKTGTGSASDAFAIGNADLGLIHYGITFDAASGGFRVTSAAGAPVYRLAKLNEGAQAIWLQSAQAWSTHMAQLRDNGSSSNALWGQAFGSVVNRDGQLGATNVDYRQDFFGAQVGYDLGRSEAGSHSVVFGVSGGYLSSHQNFKATADRVTYDTANVGGYASLRTGPFFANLLAQYDHYWIKAHDRTNGAAWSDKVGGDAYGVQAELGARLGAGRFFAEPAVSLAWQRGEIGTIHAFGQSIDFDVSNALTGRAGARVGGTIDLPGGTQAVFYARGNYVHEFDGKAGLLFSSGGTSQTVTNVRSGDYGEGALGINILSRGPITGFVEGNGVFGSNAKGGGGRIGVSMKF